MWIGVQEEEEPDVMLDPCNWKWQLGNQATSIILQMWYGHSGQEGTN